MNKRPVDSMTTAALRDLDPAPMTVLTDAELERADDTFARILRAPGPYQVAGASGRPRLRRILVVLGLVGAAGAAVPVLLLGGNSAFASWTSKPVPLTEAAATEAATTCRDIVGMPDHGERVVNAERRGDWTYVLIAGPQAEGSCVMHNDLVGEHNDLNHRRGYFGSYVPHPVKAPTPARDRIVETGTMDGSVPVRGRLPFTTGKGWLSWVSGYVGSDVVGVTVHTPVGPDVEASVAHGRYSAWWPSHPPSSKHLDVMGAWTYTVTLADGSTRDVPENGQYAAPEGEGPTR